MRSRSVNLINLISNQCDLLTVMQDKKDLSKSFNKQKFCVADPWCNPKRIWNRRKQSIPLEPKEAKHPLVITNHTYKLCLYVKAQVSNYSGGTAKTSYLFLLLVKIVAFTKNYELKANKKINKISLLTRENKYLSPLDKPWERNQRFLTNLQANKISNFCSIRSNSKKDHKSLLITFSGGQDSYYSTGFAIWNPISKLIKTEYIMESSYLA